MLSLMTKRDARSLDHKTLEEMRRLGEELLSAPGGRLREGRSRMVDAQSIAKVSTVVDARRTPPFPEPPHTWACEGSSTRESSTATRPSSGGALCLGSRAPECSELTWVRIPLTFALEGTMPQRDALAREIEQLHDSPALWEATIPVREVVDGEVVWNGKVEVYLLVDHDKAKRCYAWIGETAAGEKCVHVVLELPPIASAVDAVRTTLGGSA